jgi:hypothetical protein
MKLTFNLGLAWGDLKNESRDERTSRPNYNLATANSYCKDL